MMTKLIAFVFLIAVSYSEDVQITATPFDNDKCTTPTSGADPKIFKFKLNSGAVTQTPEEKVRGEIVSAECKDSDKEITIKAKFGLQPEKTFKAKQNTCIKFDENADLYSKITWTGFCEASDASNSKNEGKVKVTATAYMNDNCSGSGLVALDGEEYTLGGEVTCEDGNILVIQGEKYENEKCVSKIMSGMTVSTKVTWTGDCNSKGSDLEDVFLTVEPFTDKYCTKPVLLPEGMPMPKDIKQTLGKDGFSCEGGNTLVVEKEGKTIKTKQNDCVEMGPDQYAKFSWTGACGGIHSL